MSENLFKEIGSRIKEVRERNSWTQSEFSLLLGLGASEKNVEKLENGIVPISFDQLKEYARILGCSPDILLGHEYGNKPLVDCKETELSRKHGRWIYYPKGSWEKKDVYKCSCCGNFQDFVVSYHFCPVCGAQMDLPMHIWFRGKEMTIEEWQKKQKELIL